MGGAIARAQRVEREEAEDVGEEQLLMLLLMLHAKLDKLHQSGVSIAARRKELAQARIHMSAIGQNLLAGRACQQATVGARMARACWRRMGPVSRPSPMSMVVLPVTVSPLAMAHWMGAAPR